MALIDNYSQQELSNIVAHSFSFQELTKKLGYTSNSGSLLTTIKNKLKVYNISTEHFQQKQRIQRNAENIFIKDSTACQKTLRKWYKEGNYTNYKCSICGQPPVWQGKELTLILDHINGENHDDRLQNLRWVCPNCNQQLDTTNGKNRKNLIKKKYCIDCGKEITKSSTRCASCASKLQKRKVENRPTREELKNMIRILPFTQIAKEYNVADNTIRKWCDGYNLPRKKADIEKYSDLEWTKI